MDRGSGQAVYRPWGCKESDVTEHTRAMVYKAFGPAPGGTAASRPKSPWSQGSPLRVALIAPFLGVPLRQSREVTPSATLVFAVYGRNKLFLCQLNLLTSLGDKS